MTAETIVNTIGTIAVLAVLWGMWRTVLGTALFKVVFRNGKAVADRGTVTKAFLDHVDRVFTAENISSGKITGWPSGKLVRLSFSRQIPEPVRQQVRNWWAVNGWPAPHRRTRKERTP
jgi:hypothetical protein